MRILVVTHNNNEKSGANKSLLSLLKQWNGKFEIEVLVNRTDGNLCSALEKLGIKYIFANYSWVCVSERDNWIRSQAVYIRQKIRYKREKREISIIKRLLEDRKIDVIYTNTSVVDFGAYLANELGIPHVWHVREFGEEDFHFRYIIDYKTRIELYNSAKYLIVISKVLQNKYLKMVSSSNIRVVPNGLSINDYLGNIQTVLHKPIQVLIAGQISESKGQGQAIAAIDMLSERYDIILNIAGQGNNTYLRNELAKCKNEKCIKVLGQVDNLFELRSGMDIEIICSESEAFGRVTIEAMLHGLPVIGAAAGGTIELIKDKKNGLLYESKNIVDLVQKIEQIILDDTLRLKISEAGQIFAQNFDIESTAEKIEQIFMSLSELEECK